MEVSSRRVQSNNATQRLQEARLRSRSADRVSLESVDREDVKVHRKPPDEKSILKVEREEHPHPPKTERVVVSTNITERDERKGGGSLHVDTVALIRRIAAKTITENASK